MTNEDLNWQSRAAARRKARLAPWRDCFIAGAILGVAIPLAALTPQPVVRIPLIGLAIVAGVVGMIRGTLNYMRQVDEQERDANLWGCYVGMCAYLMLYLGVSAAGMLGHPVRDGHDMIFVATMAITMAVFCWKRFR